MKDLQKERLLELLADQTIFGLSEEEVMELGQIKKQFPDWEDDVSLELTAAMIGLSDLDTNDMLPANLRAKIFANADVFFSPNKESQEALNFTPKANTAVGLPATESGGNIIEIKTKQPFWQWFGWGLAATACIALVISLWLMRTPKEPEIALNTETVKTPEVAATPQTVKTPESVKTPEAAQTPESVKTPESVRSPESVKTPEPARTPKIVKTPEVARTPEPVKTPAPELTASQKREQLISSAPDVIQTNWTSAKDDKRVLGDVVWSNAQQKGYVRLRGMPVLDASKETYQLWIIDERDEKTPVSGGIFNVSRTGEIIIPINAQLRINKPKQFAVSKEKAGGVVVTKPDRIVAVAKI
ncbi:MAG: anti-sigma factor [Acidobacteria bacterium]|jgi:anti-sigma-K factor RskA|nr:anti-sigma factor [Acidobacteriota bacterium]